jgi:hypothetical protein
MGAASRNIKVTVANSTASTVIDLTSTSINPGAAPTSTPRQGGFTLRNRINFTNVALANKKLFNIASSGAAAQAGNVLRVLEVPERVQVNRVNLYAVKSETVPGSVAVGSASGLHASHLASAAIGVGVEQRSKPLSSASYNALSHLDLQLTAQNGMGAGAQFGEIALEAAGASVDGCGFTASQVEAVDTSMTAPELARIVTQVAGTGSAIYYASPAYFALGGYIYLGCTNVSTGSASLSTSKADSTYVKLTGTWEVQAECTYVPE